jgi:hypothetical protein
MALPAREPSSAWKRNAFAIVELPLAICLLMALFGIVCGATLWYRSGRLTTGVVICFVLVTPLLAILAVISLSVWRNQSGGK